MRRSNQAPSIAIPRGVRLVALALVLLAQNAFAGQYQGRGDTGWTHTDKRECCNEAIALAQHDSAAVCQNVGGSPPRCAVACNAAATARGSRPRTTTA